MRELSTEVCIGSVRFFEIWFGERIIEPTRLMPDPQKDKLAEATGTGEMLALVRSADEHCARWDIEDPCNKPINTAAGYMNMGVMGAYIVFRTGESWLMRRMGWPVEITHHLLTGGFSIIGRSSILYVNFVAALTSLLGNSILEKKIGSDLLFDVIVILNVALAGYTLSDVRKIIAKRVCGIPLNQPFPNPDNMTMRRKVGLHLFNIPGEAFNSGLITLGVIKSFLDLKYSPAEEWSPGLISVRAIPSIAMAAMGAYKEYKFPSYLNGGYPNKPWVRAVAFINSALSFSFFWYFIYLGCKDIDTPDKEIQETFFGAVFVGLTLRAICYAALERPRVWQSVEAFLGGHPRVRRLVEALLPEGWMMGVGDEEDEARLATAAILAQQAGEDAQTETVSTPLFPPPSSTVAAQRVTPAPPAAAPQINVFGGTANIYNGPTYITNIQGGNASLNQSAESSSDGQALRAPLCASLFSASASEKPCKISVTQIPTQEKSVVKKEPAKELSPDEYAQCNSRFFALRTAGKVEPDVRFGKSKRAAKRQRQKANQSALL